MTPTSEKSKELIKLISYFNGILDEYQLLTYAILSRITIDYSYNNLKDTYTSKSFNDTIRLLTKEIKINKNEHGKYNTDINDFTFINNDINKYNRLSEIVPKSNNKRCTRYITVYTKLASGNPTEAIIENDAVINTLTEIIRNNVDDRWADNN